MTRILIIPRVTGGIGNQLFIYAAARRLAFINGAELVLDDVSGFAYDTKYKRHYQLDHFSIPCRKATNMERMEPFARVQRYLTRKWNQRLPFDKRRYLVQENVDFDERLLTFKPRGRVYLEGYWQSEDYFKDIEPQIRADLYMQPPVDAENLRMARHIRATNSIAIHLRFFDTPTLTTQAESQNNAPADYYQRAIQFVRQCMPDAHYFIFSDQPQAARARLSLPDDQVTLVNNNQGDSAAYADLWLMRQCRHFIIANSTFSWWGAWLAEHKGKLIIAPALNITHTEKITSWGFRGLLPKNWILK
jgi:hypothetical protein